MKSLFKYLLLSVAIVLMPQLHELHAQSPLVKAEITSVIVTNNNYFDITWNTGRMGYDLEDIAKFELFEYGGYSDDMSQFKLNTTINSIDSALVETRGDYDSWYWYFTSQTNSFVNTYFILVTMKDGQTFASKIYSTKENHNKDVVTFENEEYMFNAALNKEFKLELKAKASNGGTVKYLLQDGPDGMKVDETTGVLTWTPKKAYSSGFTVKGYSESNGKLIYTYYKAMITVSECDVLASISLQMVNQKGSGVPYQTLFLMNLDLTNSYTQAVSSDKEGNVEFKNIDKGRYVVGSTIRDGEVNAEVIQYYPGTYDINKATIFEVECGHEYAVSPWEVEIKESELQIVSEPYTVIGLGETWTYLLYTSPSEEYILKLGSELKYELVNAPAGMTLNEHMNGFIQWTPTEKGVYEFQVIATALDQTFTQNIRLEVGDCRAMLFAYAMGNGMNDIIRGDYSFITYISSDNGTTWNEKEKEKTEGYINKFVSVGEFIKYKFAIENAKGEKYYAGNTSDINAATIFSPTCLDSIMIAFELPKEFLNEDNKTHIYKLSGNVYIGKSLVGLPQVPIVIEGYNAINNHYLTKKVFTNQDGYFVVELPSGYFYTLCAMDTKDKEGNHYSMTCYAETNSKTFEMNGDKEILLSMNSITTIFENSLSGVMLNEDGEALANTYVLAFMVSSTTNSNDRLYKGSTVITDENGKFNFVNLSPGSYVLYAKNISLKSAGYYLESNPSVSRWTDASFINITENDKVESIQFVLKSHKEGDGGGIIKGNTRASNGLVKNENNSQEGNAISDVNVYVSDINGNLYSVDWSKESGEFEISNLPLQSYLVIFDKVGYETKTMVVEVLSEDTPVEIEAEIKPLALESSVDDFFDNQLLAFPNPATMSISINGIEVEGMAKIEVFGMNGEVYTNYEMQVNAGSVMFSVNTLPSGKYIAKITSGNSIYHSGFTIAR